MNIFIKIGNFISCLLHENCEYSVKKILTYVFSILVLYMAIFTDKNYYDILIFIGALLGIRGYERVKLWKKGSNDQQPDQGGSMENSMLGVSNPSKSSKQLLTD